MAVTKMNPNATPKELVDEVSLCLQQGMQGVPSAGLSPVSHLARARLGRTWLCIHYLFFAILDMRVRVGNQRLSYWPTRK